MEIGAGTSFNVDEKDFIKALYGVLQRLFEAPRLLSMENADFMSLLKAMDIVFCQRK